MTQVTAEMTPAEAFPSDYWVTIPAGPFTMGSDELREDGKRRAAAPEHQVDVAEFRMAKHPVTVAEFRRFVEATGHVTDAEKKGKSWVWIGDPAVVVPDQDYLWKNIEGASWRTPHGPGSTLEGKDNHPVTHVSSSTSPPTASGPALVCRRRRSGRRPRAVPTADATRGATRSPPPSTATTP